MPELIEVMISDILNTIFGNQLAWIGIFSVIIWLMLLIRMKAPLELTALILGSWVLVASGLPNSPIAGYFNDTIKFVAMLLIMGVIGMFLFRVVRRTS